MLPDRSPATNGELQVSLDNLTQMLRDMKADSARGFAEMKAESAKSFEEIKNNFVTREYFDAKFDNYNNRMVRLESDLKELTLGSAEARARLQADIATGRTMLNTTIDNKVAKVEERIDNIEKAQVEQAKTLQAQRNNRIQAITIVIIGAILSIIGSIVATGATQSLFPAAGS